ncbi:hypothetical protein [Saccharibacillus kuerlensis]|uniref:Uncharacterized protein n=1 Tax=Saccharibacillus kuerlensis TaxID=459527 RepID=A0ABQ2L6I5_9BACL|nr:hypothetical protein [Saccharibacillus kuerlensis]GGO04949.1 hypothetical protein GCM10010969_30790 [Saccharibacillus kuerlensis]
MRSIREHIPQDEVIERVTKQFACRVLWSEGRPCLEYTGEAQLQEIEAYVRGELHWDLYDVFFTAVESLPAEA